MQVALVMFRDSGRHRAFALHKPQTIIGRREDCDMRIPVSDVSRKHCRVILDGGELAVEDLGSSNGTFVNGQRVQRQELSAGDTVQVGPVTFVVQIDGAPDLAQLGAAKPKAEKPTTASIDGELDELSILNADSGAGGEIDFDPNSSK